MRNMSKKKVLIIALVALAVITSLAFAVPALAAGSSAPPNPSQITPANKPGALIRLLLVQDQTKAFAYIDQAEAAGKITSDQDAKIKDFWTAHHKQFVWNFVLRRLLRAQNENNVKTYLDMAVSNGKINQTQENKIIQIWEILHNVAPATTTAQ
jgi:flagellar basal body-associated protein FliL